MTTGRGRKGIAHTLTSAPIVFLRALFTQFRLIRNQWVIVAKPRYSWDICRVIGVICQLGQHCGQQTGAKLSVDSAIVADIPRTARSRVSNGSATFLDGVDGRTALARRYRDILAQLVADIGGDPSEAQNLICRRAATLAVWCETAEVALANGSTLDIGEFTTATNSLRRLLSDIGLERRARPIAGLGDILRGRHG